MTTPCYVSQFALVVSPQLAALSVGGAVTYPTLLMEQFRVNGSSVQLDIGTRSWIGSIYGLAGIPAFLMPIITENIGRKLGYIITCVFIILGWALGYGASTTTEILVSESFLALGTNSLLPVFFQSTRETLAPKYSVLTMLMFGISQRAGMAVCGILGRYIHYKTVSLCMLVPIVLAVTLALIWPESPPWLACKKSFVGKFTRAFDKLRGADPSQREIREIMMTDQNDLGFPTQDRSTLKSLLAVVLSRSFYMPSLHIFILFLMIHWSGYYVVYVYFIEIISKTTNNEDAALYSSITMYLIVLGSLFVKYMLGMRFQNKTVLISSSCGMIVFLLASSLVSGLQTAEVLSNESLLLLYSLLGYMACASVGLSGAAFDIASELMPMKNTNMGGSLYILINCILYSSSLKISPYISLYLGLWCIFLIYAINAMVCIVLVWKYVPETKDRRFQEIEDYYKVGRFNEPCVFENPIYGYNLLTTNNY